MNTYYELYFHYMHYYPKDIVKMKIAESLLERTLDLLRLDPAIVVHDVKKVEVKKDV